MLHRESTIVRDASNRRIETGINPSTSRERFRSQRIHQVRASSREVASDSRNRASDAILSCDFASEDSFLQFFKYARRSRRHFFKIVVSISLKAAEFIRFGTVNRSANFFLNKLTPSSIA